MLILQNKLYYLVLVGSQLQWLFGNKKRVSSRAIYLFHLFWCWAIFSILHTFSGLHPVASYHCGILECLLHHFLYICMHIENANNVERQKMFDPCESKYNRKIQISFNVNTENIWNLTLGVNKILKENVAILTCIVWPEILPATNCKSISQLILISYIFRFGLTSEM